MKKRDSHKNGYSLIELTIVVGLVSILSIAISAIVLSTIVNSNRIKTQIRLRQTGDYAIGQIKTLIRNSKGIASCDSASNTVTITNQDGRTTAILLEGAKIASNSGTYLTPQDTEISNFVLSCSPSDSTPQLINLSFTMSKTDSENDRAIEKPTQVFSTSIEIRNE